jgi:hypothetical protein
VLLPGRPGIIQPVAQIPFLISEILATPTTLTAVRRITAIPLVTAVGLVTAIGFLSWWIVRALLLRRSDPGNIGYRDLDRRLLLTDSGGTGQHYRRGSDETDPHFHLPRDTPFL